MAYIHQDNIFKPHDSLLILYNTSFNIDQIQHQQTGFGNFNANQFIY